MRLSSVLLATLLTGAAVAQVTIPPHASIYNGFSRGFTFTAATPFFITQLELPTNAQQVGDTAGFLVRVNGVTALHSVGNATALIPTNIPVAIGDIVDVIGNWSPVVTNNFSAHNSYGNTAPYATTIEGVPHTLQRSGWQWDIGDPAWSTSGVYLPPTTGALGRVLMYTSAAPTGTVFATNTNLGAGCIANFNSFYESFANATVASAALNGNVLSLTPTPSGYQGAWLPGSAAALYVAPVGATQLLTGDDGDVALVPSAPLATPYGAQATLRVSGNGIVAFGGALMDYPGTNSYTPTPAGLLNSLQGGVYAWHDFNQAELGSGQIVSHEAGGTLYVTWNDVENYANPETANRSTVQFQFVLATGDIRVVWLSVDANATSTWGSAHVVGFSAPGASLDPGAITLSSASAQQLAVASPESAGLALAGVTRPITGTAWNLTTSSIPATGAIGVQVLGLTDPGINDLFFLGAPGCGLRANLDALAVFVVTGPTHNWGVAIPANPTLLGLHLYATSAVAQVPSVNAFGFITSNGVDGLIGDY